MQEWHQLLASNIKIIALYVGGNGYVAVLKLTFLKYDIQQLAIHRNDYTNKQPIRQNKDHQIGPTTMVYASKCTHVNYT